MNLKELLLQVNSGGLSLFPLSRFNAVSLFTSDYYENYDYDIVLPGQRSKLVSILKKFDFKQTSGRVITNREKTMTFEFARPNFTLGDDPAEKTARLIKKSDSIIVITPTQALLIYMKEFYDEMKLEKQSETSAPLSNELTALLYEQPANLDKVREWLTPSARDDLFVSLKRQFRQAQQQGIDDRKEFRFKSRISEHIEAAIN